MNYAERLLEPLVEIRISESISLPHQQGCSNAESHIVETLKSVQKIRIVASQSGLENLQSRFSMGREL